MSVLLQTELVFEGPFAARSGCKFPFLGNSSSGLEVGIYMWTVDIGDHYRVAYLGKTAGATRSFGKRIAEEVERFKTGADGSFDVELFRRGIRKEISRPTVGADVLLGELIDCSPIFVAPVECEGRTLLVLESALIRRIQSRETKPFLAHGRSPMRELLRNPITVRAPDGVMFEGLDGCIE